MRTAATGEYLACDIFLPSDPNLTAHIMVTPDIAGIRHLLVVAGFVVVDGVPSTYPGCAERFFKRAEELRERGEIGDYCVLVDGLFVERFEKRKRL